MTPDPQLVTLAAAAVGGALAAEAGKDAYSLLKQAGKSTIDRIRKRLEGPALVQADQNLAQFDEILTTVQTRDERVLAARGIAVQDPGEAIEDPDKFHAFHTAATSAARTSSAERHRLLAEALSMRFRTASHDDKATIMNRAVEVVAQIGPRHLDVLGLLACVHGVRPDQRDRAAIQNELDDVHRRVNELYPKNHAKLEALKGEARKAAVLEHNAEGDRISKEADPLRERLRLENARYVDRILESLTHHKSGWSATDQDSLYLSSAGCVVVERAVYRELADQYAGNSAGRIEWELRSAIEVALRPIQFADLRASWETTLQHCAVTPVGFVLGLMIHDHRANTDFAHEWEWGTLQPVDHARDTWDGMTRSEITKSIVADTKRSISDDARRLDAAHGVLRR